MAKRDRFEIGFVTFAKGLRRTDDEAGWRLCAFVKILANVEAKRAAEALKVGDQIHIGNVEFEHTGLVRLTARGPAVHIFIPSGASREISVGSTNMPILPASGVDFAALLTALKRAGYKPTIGKVIRAKPTDRRQ